MTQGHQPKKIKSIDTPPKSGSSVEKSESKKEKLEMKLTQYDEEDYDNYYILRGLNSNSDRVLFEISLEDFPSNQTIEKIIKNKSEQTFYLIDTLEIEEVKSKITRFIIDEN